MATEDESKGGEGEAASPRPPKGRNRGERDQSSGRGGPPSDRDFEAQLSRMDPARLAAVIASAQARVSSSRGPATPKISRTLDQLDEGQAREVIAACDEALEAWADAERNREAVNEREVIGPIESIAPEVVAAMYTNSSYRQKPLKHSVSVTRQYLAAKHGADDQAAA